MGTILVTKKSRIKFLLGAYILGRVENLEIHKQKKKKKSIQVVVRAGWRKLKLD